jgi:hypothetical protein
MLTAILVSQLFEAITNIPSTLTSNEKICINIFPEIIVNSGTLSFEPLNLNMIKILENIDRVRKVETTSNTMNRVNSCATMKNKA